MNSKFIIVSLSALSMLSLTSCEGWLDKQAETSQNEEMTFSSYDNAVTTAYSVYTDLPRGFDEIWGSSSSAMMASAVDEAEFTIQTHNVQKFNMGSWMPTSMPDNPMSKYYASFRKAYNFIENADKINYDDVKDNVSMPGVYEQYLENIKLLKQEVLVLRAFYMLEMAKRYGGMPIVNGKFNQDTDASQIQRASLKDCIDEIVKTCDSASFVLPVKHLDSELGRLTKGAALAIKADALLFSASELWNNPSWAGGFANPELISLPSGDRNERWRQAADAAKAVIDLKAEAGYDLEDDHKNLYNTTSFRSKEIIFCRRAGTDNSFEKTNYPISYDHVTGGNCPSGNLVDMFQVLDANGQAVDFDWNNPEMRANPYENRDPRLAKFVITNNSYFKDRNVECWTGGRDGAGVRNATPTGYYLKKFVYEWQDLTTDAKSVHTWIFYRLAEMYLNYAEALNEYDPGNPDIKVYYDLVRNRAGMPGLPSGLDQTQVRKLIRQERTVELCFEGKRFFDLRRWMDEDALKAPLRSVKITKTETGFEYKPYDLEERVFSKKMYFYPIPQSEIIKMPHWSQNPLWN